MDCKNTASGGKVLEPIRSLSNYHNQRNHPSPINAVARNSEQRDLSDVVTYPGLNRGSGNAYKLFRVLNSETRYI